MPYQDTYPSWQCCMSWTLFSKLKVNKHIICTSWQEYYDSYCFVNLALSNKFMTSCYTCLMTSQAVIFFSCCRHSPLVSCHPWLCLHILCTAAQRWSVVALHTSCSKMCGDRGGGGGQSYDHSVANELRPPEDIWHVCVCVCEVCTGVSYSHGPAVSPILQHWVIVANRNFKLHMIEVVGHIIGDTVANVRTQIAFSLQSIPFHMQA